MAAGRFRHRDALLEHLQHRPVPLLHHTQLHQHTRLPPPRPLMDRSEATSTPESPQPARSVAKEPELLSPGYRNRVRKLSPGNQNRDVKHLPGSHKGPGGHDLPDSSQYGGSSHPPHKMGAVQ
jgi:hypothetical protein